MRKFLNILVIFFIVTVFFTNDEAKAYINPGSGSYIFQTVIGGILSILYFFKKIFISVINLFKPKNKTTKSESANE